MRLSIGRNSQRGVTLVELVIVIGLIAVIAVSVSLLTASLQKIVAKNESATDEMDNLTMARENIEKWFYSFDSSEYSYNIVYSNNVNNSKNILEIKKANSLYAYITLEEENIKFYKDNTLLTQYYFKGLKQIIFEKLDNKQIYKCTFKYDTKDSTDKSFTFVLSLKCIK